eukprot:10178436-Alexandrium_andersonii.AAC.1
MSASLVGSEMCIRDSSDLGNLGHGGFLANLPKTNLALAVRAIRDEVPVSYTHLTLPTICSV